VKYKKYTEKVFPAFCVEFFSFAAEKLRKIFLRQIETEEYGA